MVQVGDPDFETPTHITSAAIDALHAGKTHYEGAGGSPSLKEAVAAFLRRTRPGLAVDPANIVCTPGGKPIIFHTIAALCEEGDEVIYPDPGFPAYETTIEWSGAKAVPLQLDESTGFRFATSASAIPTLTAFPYPDPRFSHEKLESLANDRTKLIVLCSPGNPSGGVLTAEDLDKVAEIAQKCGAWVISDEIYSQLIFDGGRHETIATRPGMAERTVVLDGCSKAFAMTGWRVGFGLFPPSLVEPAKNLAINSWTCLPPFVSAGGIAALDGPDADTAAMRAEFQARRDIVYEALNQIPGISIAVKPAGAIYLLANVTGTGLGSREFAERLLDEQAVALLDGAYFGAGGEGLVRISFAQSRERLAEGCARIAKFVEGL